MAKLGYPNLIFLLLILLSFASTPIRATSTRKLDESTIPGVGEKCTPCSQLPPPPVPCPPPPALPPPPPPPTIYCPPPPSTYIYVAGPLGNLYPVDQYFGGGGRGLSHQPWLPVGFGLMGVLLLW
ncbi:hypothetical protein MLD38_017527 [Melastoma candidum]|uniref:Uncharacterized protein n=1 Tax=Melastoma candidum TaxID=119954 RepID=A0ACB9QUE6_9MYRT|nr:hypothetical protein MLD38_017527 [Melastoma candidum]